MGVGIYIYIYTVCMYVFMYVVEASAPKDTTAKGTERIRKKRTADFKIVIK